MPDNPYTDNPYTARDVTKGMIQASFILSTMTPTQRMKMLEVLVAKFICDGDIAGIRHAANVVRINTP